MSRRSTKNKSPMKKIIASLVAVAIVALGGLFLYKTFLAPTDQASETKVAQTTQKLLRHRQRKKNILRISSKAYLEQTLIRSLMCMRPEQSWMSLLFKQLIIQLI